jgi:hypothetical protein
MSDAIIARDLQRIYRASCEENWSLDFLDWEHCDEAAAYLARQPSDLDTLAQTMAETPGEEMP